MVKKNTHNIVGDASAPSAKRTIVLVSLLLGFIGAVLATKGIMQRQNNTEALRIVAQELSIPTVSVVRPIAADKTVSLVLPGTMEPLNSAAIYAQTTGYIKEWRVDIGDHVVKDQVLAVLDAPELEHQIAQAKADYSKALAEQDNAQSMANRANRLSKIDSGAVSVETLEQRQREAQAKIAASAAALANVQRLESLKKFTRLTAPFAGIVTSRTAQLGELVVAGTAGATPLFSIADTTKLRVFVSVPQHEALNIERGQSASLKIPGYDNRHFDAVVSRSAGAVESATGAVLVELQVDNTDKLLLPGAYVQVNFTLSNNNSRVNIPGSAIIFRNRSPVVAVLDAENKVALKTVTLGRDYGSEVEIVAGLTVHDTVVSTPPDAIQNGDIVRVHCCSSEHQNK